LLVASGNATHYCSARAQVGSQPRPSASARQTSGADTRPPSSGSDASDGGHSRRRLRREAGAVPSPTYIAEGATSLFDDIPRPALAAWNKIDRPRPSTRLHGCIGHRRCCANNHRVRQLAVHAG
jgi:hypothetical protein